MKIGLILGGGGARGSYQLGVIKALLEHNLLKDLNLVAGTSIGAVNSCLVMEKRDYGGMLDFWKEIDNKHLYKLERNKTGSQFGLFDQSDMYEVLVQKQDKEKVIHSDILGFAAVTKVSSPLDQSEKTFSAEIMSLNDTDDPHKIVLASASIPVIFTPTEIDGNHYVDGGLLNNLPVNVAIDHNCDVIIVIGLSHYRLDKYDVEKKLMINFSPAKRISKTLLGVLDFNENTLEKNIEHGYEEATALINELLNNGVINKHKKFSKNHFGLYQLNHKLELEIKE